MNREILFRGKRVDNGEWVEGYLFDDGYQKPEHVFVGGLIIDEYEGTACDEWDIRNNRKPSEVSKKNQRTDKKRGSSQARHEGGKTARS